MKDMRLTLRRIGAIVAVAALALPWVAFHLQVSVAGVPTTQTQSMTPWELYVFTTSPSPPTPRDPSASPLPVFVFETDQQMLGGVDVILLGALLIVAGAILAVARPFGGIVMTAGSVVSVLAALLTTGALSGGTYAIHASFSLDLGLLLALGASAFSLLAGLPVPARLPLVTERP